MIFLAEHVRPPSLLRRSPASPGSVVVGLLLAALVHLGLPALVWLGWHWGGGKGRQERPPLSDQVVEARFVQLGKPFDPSKLPQRIVPRLETAPPDEVAVSDEPDDAPPKPDATPPPDTKEDSVRRLGDRAKAFAEIAEAQEREGDPQGLAEGTAREARPGDLYRGQLYLFFRRNWSVPTVLSDEDRQRLVAEFDVHIDRQLHIDHFRMRRSSGNALFDQSIDSMLAGLQQGRVTLPAPPADVAELFLGKAIALRFRGNDG